jgi:O-antigen/teichoic acid export membrane protein
MRWTVWLAAIAWPFSYITTALLARISPEAIGTYGLLTVYISVFTAFLYFGGDSVVIRFIPELNPAERRAFLGSYLVLICLTAIPWLGLAFVWPSKLRYLFGEGSSSFYLLILCLSPLCIAFSVIVSSLKGMLEMRWAQALVRVLTIGSCVVYIGLYFAARSFFKMHYTGLIWGIYLGFVTFGAAIGLRRLKRLNEWTRFEARPRFFLPRGFWRYAFATQQVGIVWFLIQRMDYILVLNFGGLQYLGKYVAVCALGLTVPIINGFLIDTLLPALSNLIAANNYRGASEVFAMHMRILFAVDMAVASGLMLLAGPLTTVLGAKYVVLRVPVILMTLLVGIASPGAVGGTLLSAGGKQQLAVWVGLTQFGLFVCLFLFFWPRWLVLGAAVAYGLSMVTSYTMLLIVAKRYVPIRFSVTGDYVKFAAFATVTAGLSLGRVSVPVLLLIWAAVVALFLVSARYRFNECVVLLRCFVPLRLEFANANASRELS